MKVRLGYGMAGNNRIDSYLSLAVLNSVTYPNGDSTQSGYVPKQIPNPTLNGKLTRHSISVLILVSSISV